MNVIAAPIERIQLLAARILAIHPGYNESIIPGAVLFNRPIAGVFNRRLHDPGESQEDTTHGLGYMAAHA